jgi:hypothetical protein
MTVTTKIIDYRDLISDRLTVLKSQDPKGYSAQKMSKFVRVHPPFLSAVLRKRLHFNSDQVFLAGRYLELSPSEHELLELLFEANRTTSNVRREALNTKIESIKKKLNKTTDAICHQKPDQNSADWFEYFADSRHQILHMAISIEAYRDNPFMLQERLSMSEEEFRNSLKLLQKLELIARDGSKFVVRNDALHLPDHHRAVGHFQNSARIAALKLPRHDDDTRFSVFFTADTAASNAIRREFNKFLKAIQPIVKEAPAESLYQINFDFLNWL